MIMDDGAKAGLITHDALVCTQVEPSTLVQRRGESSSFTLYSYQLLNTENE